jgi:cell division transport system permease protein
MSPSANTARHLALQTFKNVARSPFLTLVSIATIAVSLILTGFFGYVFFQVNSLLDDVGRDLRITVFLTDGTPPEQIAALAGQIKGREEVDEVEFLSAREDRERNRALLPASLLEGLDEDSIPGQPCLEVSLKKRQRLKDDFENLAQWINGLKGVGGVEDILFGADKIRLVFVLIDAFKYVGVIISLVIFFASVFFVFSTIKLAVYSRRDEIEILRLVGATDAFIKIPFYAEGVLHGIAGAAAATAIVLGMNLQLAFYMEEQHNLNWQLDLLPGPLVAWFFVAGTLLGLLGSMSAIGRYLRT